jgi:2-hydroxy-6-oxonona-2,4-dienedioate hydrolase
MMMLREVDVGGRPSKVWTGGEGEPLVLVHGGWGGAEMHWAPVWERLAERCEVIAPELPGIGDRALPALSSFDAYAGWIVQLLDALGIPHAWCVGNSFGAAVVWELAARLGPCCRGVVLVNGMPFEMPPLIRGLAAIPPVRRLLRILYRKLAFSPTVLPRAYADPKRAPAELRQVLRDPPPTQLDAMLGIAYAGTRSAPPVAPLLIVWGEADRLPGTSRETARKLQRRVAGARLIFVPSAGHCPQVERPGEFVEAITSFMTSSSGAGLAD